MDLDWDIEISGINYSIENVDWNILCPVSSLIKLSFIKICFFKYLYSVSGRIIEYLIFITSKIINKDIFFNMRL